MPAAEMRSILPRKSTFSGFSGFSSYRWVLPGDGHRATHPATGRGPMLQPSMPVACGGQRRGRSPSERVRGGTRAPRPSTQGSAYAGPVVAWACRPRAGARAGASGGSAYPDCAAGCGMAAFPPRRTVVSNSRANSTRASPLAPSPKRCRREYPMAGRHLPLVSRSRAILRGAAHASISRTVARPRRTQ